MSRERRTRGGSPRLPARTHRIIYVGPRERPETAPTVNDAKAILELIGDLMLEADKEGLDDKAGVLGAIISLLRNEMDVFNAIRALFELSQMQGTISVTSQGGKTVTFFDPVTGKPTHQENVGGTVNISITPDPLGKTLDDLIAWVRSLRPRPKQE